MNASSIRGKVLIVGAVAYRLRFETERQTRPPGLLANGRNVSSVNPALLIIAE
jgi:hypothetical protein